MKTHTLDIRPLHEDDADECETVSLAAYPEGPITAASFRAMPAELDVFALVSVRYGEVVGYCLTILERDRFVIGDMAVLPDCRRLRIGARLVDALKLALKDRRRSIAAYARRDNAGAIAFLRSQGFTLTRLTRNYAGIHEDVFTFQFTTPE